MKFRAILVCMLLVVPACSHCAALRPRRTIRLGPAKQMHCPISDRPSGLFPRLTGKVRYSRHGKRIQDDLPNILQALHLLRTFPDYRFVLDQAAYVKPFLERYPEEAAEFRSLVSPRAGSKLSGVTM